MEPSQNILDTLRRETDAAFDAGEVPIAACVVVNGEIVAAAHNACVGTHDPCAHAEVIALRRAGAALQNYRLHDATLYVTMEPCVMCAGAIFSARVAKLVYGLQDPKAGAAGSVIDLFAMTALNHHAQSVVQSPALAQMANDALQKFFQLRRQRPKVPAFTVTEASWHNELDRVALVKIRYDVFVYEQKVPVEEEVDAQDPLSLHVLARMNKDGMPIATGRLLPNGHIGRMAVLKGYRRTGAGRAVLEFLMAKARERGFDATELSAQTHAIPFYARAGFIAYGDEYLDCGIPHRMMRKPLL